MISPGEAFPDRSLPDLDGREEPLSAAWSSGRALVVIGHGDCRTTLLALPYVDRIGARRETGSAVVAVLQDEPAAARAVVERLGLALPVRLEAPPYALSGDLGVATVPTLLLVGQGGTILRVSEAFRRHDLEGLAAALGVAPPLFEPGDEAPTLRPG